MSKKSGPESGQPEDRVEALKLLFQAGSEFIDDLRIRTEPLWEMQKWLIDRVGAGRLEAFGVMMKPERAREPQKIPAFIFRSHPKLNWSRSTVENFDQKFEGVEVRRSLGKEETSSIGTTPTRTVRGRRRVDEPLRAIVREICDEGRFTRRSQKERITLVRDRAQKRHPNTFPKKTQPSDTKIIQALKAEGC